MSRLLCAIFDDQRHDWVGHDYRMPGDITFGSNTSYYGTNLTAYVENGTIPEARVDDMATRILASWYLLGQDSPNYPKSKLNVNAFFPLELGCISLSASGVNVVSLGITRLSIQSISMIADISHY
jgi:hypothetical protein